jgi:hypothetical protein
MGIFMVYTIWDILFIILDFIFLFEFLNQKSFEMKKN